MRVSFHNTPPLSGVCRVEDNTSHLVGHKITHPVLWVFPNLAFEMVSHTGQPCQDYIHSPPQKPWTLDLVAAEAQGGQVSIFKLGTPYQFPNFQSEKMGN